MKRILALLLVTAMIIPMGIFASFADGATDPYETIKQFTDVKKGAWYVESIAYCFENGYVSGMSETKFAPNANLTRAQFLTLLAKVDGVDLSAYEGKNSGFTDVKPNHWYNTYVCWAVENKITSGLSDTKFGPNNEVTRAQLARFFYVYTEMVGGDVTGAADISGYPDASKVQSWAKAPVEWAVDAGLISGVTKGGVVHLDPNGKATRAQAARMIMVYTQIAVCEHVWGEWEVVTPATYEAEGSEKRVCTLCGNTETQIIPALVCAEHVWGEWIVVTPATYGADGSEARACTLCGKTETQVIPMLVCTEHAWSEWAVTIEPTKETEGKQERCCNTCGKVEEEILPILPDCIHEWSDWTVTKEANTFEDGSQERTCSLCNLTEVEVIPMIEKDYTITFDPCEGTMDEGYLTVYPINEFDDYNDVFPNGYPTATLEGYVFMGWLLEEYSFLLNEPEFNGNHYALNYSCTLYAIYQEAMLYDDESTPITLEVGTKTYDMPLIDQYVLFSLEPSEAGQYDITIENNVLGIVSYNGDWVTIEPGPSTVCDKTVSWECSSVGQSILIAVKSGRSYADITVDFVPAEEEEEVSDKVYENTVTPSTFTFSNDAASLVNVAFKDDVIETAVLGEDGYYHLNSATGPILYVKLADAKMDFVTPNVTSGVMEPNYRVLSVTDKETGAKTYFDTALTAYFNSADKNNDYLYPLTADLMNMYKAICEYQRGNWFDGYKFLSTTGWISGAYDAYKEDSWMFACYYIPEA